MNPDSIRIAIFGVRSADAINPDSIRIEVLVRMHLKIAANSSLLQYYQIPNLTIGGYDYVEDESGQPIPLQFHLRQFRQADLFASKRSFVLDGRVEEIQCEQSINHQSDVGKRFTMGATNCNCALALLHTVICVLY